MRTNAAHCKVDTYIHKVVFFELEGVKCFTKLFGCEGIHGARERLFCSNLEQILYCQILTSVVAAGFLRTNVLIIVVFFSRAYIVAVFTCNVLIRIAFSGTKAYVREVTVCLIYTKLNTEAWETLNVIGKLIGNRSGKNITGHFITKLKFSSRH